MATPKQKNLFSFFSKKTPTPAVAAAAATSTVSAATVSSGGKSVTSASSSSNINKGDTTRSKDPTTTRTNINSANCSTQQLQLLLKITIGTKLAIYWPDDKEYYPCLVHAHRPRDGEQHRYTLHYEDGEIETVNLAKEKFRIIGGKKRSSSSTTTTAVGTTAGKRDNAATEKGGKSVDAAKRRRILEESEEEGDEMEFDDDELDEEEEDEVDDDSGSEYKQRAGDESDDESLNAVSEKGSEDDWLESDDEDEDENKKKAGRKRKAVKKVTITRVDKSGKDGDRFVSPTPLKSKEDGEKNKATVVQDIDFSSFLSQSPSMNAAPSESKITARPSTKIVGSQPSNNNKVTTPPPIQSNNKSSSSSSQQQPVTFIPKPIPDVVNPAGSHIHNHLKFFTSNRKDVYGNSMGHPNYSPRTLSVDFNELGRLESNGKISPAQQQWWEIKSQYADTVLLFKVGKFYEMFHDDADVGVKVLGFVYMKGIAAHAGFPESAYGTMVSRLVEAGWKVARVEQTETPNDMQERKKAMGKGQKKPTVVSREVCSVVTKGTRTFCYLEDVSLLEKGEVSTGPLVVIKEILVDSSGVEDSEVGTRAVCEYGVTIVDAVTGVVTLGQFADDVLRSRMQTLLASFSPSEVLYEGGESGASKTLINFLKSACSPNTVIDRIHPIERFPKSTAVNADVRRMLDRTNVDIKPWDANEAVRELHRKGYYPRSSRNVAASSDVTEGISRWPEILRRCIEGGATLALSSFGATLFYLQRSLVDAEILNMGNVKAYAPPNNGIEATNSADSNTGDDANENTSKPSDHLQEMYDEEAHRIEGLDLVQQEQHSPVVNFASSAVDESYAHEANIDHMALDGTTLSNLEILHNIASGSCQGSLLSKIDATESPHGSRLLRAWLLRPLFRKVDIDRRADVVEELAGGSAAMAMSEVRSLLKKTGDIERLLCRVHSMGGGGVQSNGEDGAAAHHPNERAVLYETEKHTKRKVGDFSKLLNGLRAAADIPELFENVDIQTPLLSKIVRTTDDGGSFPAGMKEKLDWFFDNFDLNKAARGEFEPSRGMDDEFDNACDAIENIKRELEAYKEEMCSILQPRSAARNSWKYINTKEDSKDKYLIELPVTVNVPDDFFVKAKRGKGSTQVNKYRTPVVEQLVADLERAIEVKNAGKAAGMRLVFARFASMQSVWMAATHASAMLDALGSLAHIAVQPGFCRPMIVDCPPSANPGIEIIQGRHPCVDITHSGGDFIPNDLTLGDRLESTGAGSEARVMLLSGPNMGGKSTLLRQTCLIAILAQVGSFVPAESCALTPVDRIFTRLGASDRILCGQSTFFVELAETAAAARGASRRSLVIMDELGRGTSTFDGTAIASATVKHLVERSNCLTLFATHYHSLLEDWKNEESVKLGHMECIVEDDRDNDSDRKSNITFLYTLGDGPCPKSFGVNVARLAGLPDDVLQKAKAVSSQFEAEMNGDAGQHKIIPSTAAQLVKDISALISRNGENGEQLKQIWKNIQ